MDPVTAIGLAASAVSLVTGAIQVVQVFYKTLKEIEDRPSKVAKLMKELAALKAVLETVKGSYEANKPHLATLKLPLEGCREACVTLTQRLIENGGGNQKFRNWHKLKYMGSGITEITDLLAGYKATIMIALIDANLRVTTFTREELTGYETMIRSATIDVRTQLDEMNMRLEAVSQNILKKSYTSSDLQQMLQDDQMDFRQILAQRDAALQCLGICEDIYNHMDQTWFQVIPGESPAGIGGSHASHLPQGRKWAHSETSSAMRHMRNTLEDAQVSLKSGVTAMDRRLGAEKPHGSEEAGGETDGETVDVLKRERESAQQRLVICNEASRRASSGQIQVVEDLKTGDGGLQMAINSSGGRLEVKGWSAGVGGIQIIASVSSDQAAKAMLGLMLQMQEFANTSYEEL